MLNIFGKERWIRRDGFTFGKLFVVIATAVLLFCTPERGSGMDQFKVVGYAPNWYGSGYLNNIDYSQVTHLIYAFAIPTAEGEIRPLNDRGFMTALVKKAHENNVKVCIAIGGWSYGGAPLESTFAAATDTDAKCRTLANAMLKVVDDYGLDGIDVDWEYPRANTSRQYETLIKYLREGLDQRGEGKILTSAVAGFTTAGYSPTALGYLDWVNVMAYDGNGAAGHSPFSYAVDSTNTWKKAGLPKDKIMVGVPFYARPNWTSYSDLTAADKSNAARDKTEYKGATVYYNGLETIAQKTEFAFDNAGGVMIWEMSQDYVADKNLSLLNKIHETVKKKLAETKETEKASTEERR